MAASSVIGALRVNLGLDSAEFTNGLKKSQTEAGKFGAAMKTAFAAVAVAAAGALAGVAAAVKSNINTFDDLSKSASKIGIPIEELSKLKYAADLSGVSMEGLETAIGRLSRNMTDAAAGTGEGAKAFKALGISVKNSDGTLKSSSQVLAEIADRFAKLPDGAQKTAAAMLLMGRSGANMIPLLNGGSEALNGLLAEAKAFGLEISAETGRSAEAFNDNLSRLGYAVQGVSMGLAAALAPALVVVTDAMVRFAQALIDGMQYLPQIAEYAAVAGGSLALMFSPAILAAVGNLAIAIGVGLVGAVRALTVAIAANPLGALAVGISAAITAAYYFRDEIQKAIGVDVVQIAKDAGNLVIAAFVSAMERIKAVWQNFPNIIGAAVIGAANTVIKVVNEMVNGAKMAINDLVSTINKIPGVNIGGMETGSKTIGEIANPYAEALSHSMGDFEKTRNEIFSRDWIGEIGKSFEKSTPAAQNFGAAVGNVNQELLNLGGGGKSNGGKSEGERYSDIIDGANRRIASLQAEQQAIGMTDEAAAALLYQTDLLNEANRKGISLSSAQRAELSGLAQVMAGVEAATEKMRDTLNFAKDATKGFLSDFRQGLMNGKSLWESFGSAALNVLNKIIDKIETQLVDALFSMNSSFGGSSSGGGFLGSIFAGIGKLFGFARGGTIMPGGGGGIDSQLVMFRKSPNERVDITKPGQTLESGRGGMQVYVTPSPYFDVRVEEISDSRVANAAPSIIGRANQNVVPTMARYQNDKAGAEWRT